MRMIGFMKIIWISQPLLFQVQKCGRLSVIRATVLLSLSPQIFLSLPPSSLIPRHDLPVLISHKNLMIHMFDYHWLQ